MIKSLIHALWQGTKKIFSWIYWAYRMAAMTIGTVLMLGWALLLFKEYADQYVMLPNGFWLVPEYYDSGGVLLRDRDGTTVVTSVEAITWCNDVVYGRRRETVENHPAMSCGTAPNCEIQVDYRFLYDGGTKTLQQYETNIFRVTKYRGGERSQGIFSEVEKLKFDAEVEKRNLTAFASSNTVDYSSIRQGDSIIPEGEICRTSESRIKG